MRKIFLIFKNDIKKVFRSIIAFIVVIGLSIIPALYAWFNIAANWNPYDNSGNIKVAVVNLDKGYGIGPLKTCFGDSIVSNLKSNTQMGWEFVDKETADQGIVNGDYYAAVIISEDFSKNFISITSGKLKQPEITYLVNEKKNAIAPKITDKGIQAIETEVNSSFVEQIANIAATFLNVSSDEIAENKDEICDKIISVLNEGKNSLNSLKSTVDVVSGSMDSINSAIKANKDSLPALDDKLKNVSDFIDSVNDASTAIKAASKGISTTLESTVSSVNSLNSAFNNQLNTIMTKIKNGSSDIADDLEALTSINNKIIEVNNDIISILNKIDGSGSGEATTLISDIRNSISEISSLMDSFSKQLDDVFNALSKDTSNAAEKLESLTKINKQIISINNKLISALENLSNKFGVDTSSIVTKLNNINTKQNAIITKIEGISAKIKETGSLPKNIKSEIDALLNETKNSFSQIKKDINSVISNIKIDVKISDITAYLKSMNDTQTKIIQKINNAVEVLRSTSKLPDNFESEIKSLIDSTTNSISRFKNDYLTPAKNAIDKILSKSSAALDEVSDTLRSSKTVDDIDNALTSAQKIVSSVNSNFSNIDKFIDKTVKSIDSIIEKVNNLKNNSNIENLISTVVSDPKAISEFISSPVKINTEKVFPVDNYGSAMAPFYTILAIWVGGIVLVAVMKPELSRHDIKKVGSVKSYQEFFGRYLIFMIIALLQSTIIVLGDVLFLKIQCDNMFLMILTCWISAIIFSLFIYSITITFSVIGKALAVIVLVIQVAGSGGTFPPELLPGFFQAIIRFLPFNYAINAFRETVAGVNYYSYWENILYLSCFIPLSLIIGILFRKPCIKAMKFFNKKLEETDLIL